MAKSMHYGNIIIVLAKISIRTIMIIICDITTVVAVIEQSDFLALSILDQNFEHSIK